MNLNDWIDIINNKSYGSYNLLAIVDAVLFLLFLIAVMYLLIFAVAALKKKSAMYPNADRKHKFVFLIPAYDADSVILNSVSSILKQNYPKSYYDIVVIASEIQQSTIELLEELSVKVIEANTPDNTKTSLLQYGVSKLNKAYDMAVILDSNNLISPNFLDRINDAYYSGCMVIQTHRASQKTQTNVEILMAVSEEINNTIFRKGHVRLGFSSALISSGMAIDYTWLKENIFKLDKNAFDKQLEVLLFSENIFIEYLEDVYTYDKKVSNSSDFYKQRRNWSTMHSSRNIWSFFSALFNENWDYCDKLFQWMMPSRLILLGLLFLFSVAIFIIDWFLAIKWFGLCFMMVVTLALSIPDKMVTKKFRQAIALAPLLFILIILGRFGLYKHK